MHTEKKKQLPKKKGPKTGNDDMLKDLAAILKQAIKEKQGKTLPADKLGGKGGKEDAMPPRV